MSNIGNLLTIENIVSGRLFLVPDYQRGYSWEEPQWADLVHDIEHVCTKDYMHYTGTIVLTKSERGERYDIVDGQQRLTTLVILLSEIYRHDKVRFAEIREKYMTRCGEDVLTLNGDNRQFFYVSVLEGEATMIADTRSKQNIANAVQYFREYISANQEHIEACYRAIVRKLGFLCFVASNNSEVGCMFEVINNRGKGLSELEKIKNFFIYLSTIYGRKDLHHAVDSRWGEILRNLNKAGFVSNEKENEFLRNCYLVFYSNNKARSWHVYDELKARYPSDDGVGKEDIECSVDEIGRFVSFLLSASLHTAWFYSDQSVDVPAGCRIWLDRLRCHHVNASVYPLYLAVMSRLENSLKPAALELIEKFNFRIYVLPNANISRTDSMQGTVFEWAYRLYHQEVTWNEVYGFVQAFLDEYGSLRVVVESLTTDANEAIDYYTWGGLRYLLGSYEEHLHQERKESWDIKSILRKRKDSDKTNDYLSLEHIWARANKADDFGGACVEKRRMGNFVLLGMSDNIVNKDKDIKDKIDEMQSNKADTSLLQVNELPMLYDEGRALLEKRWQRKGKNYYKELSQYIDDRREEKIIRFALDRWRVDGEGRLQVIIDSFNADGNTYYTITPLNE